MEQLYSPKQVEGKTVKTYAKFFRSLIIVFEDDTYIAFEIDMGYESGDAEIALSMREPDFHEKFHAGIISEEEYEKEKKREQRNHNQNVRRRERAELARLKEKYERKKK